MKSNTNFFFWLKISAYVLAVILLLFSLCLVYYCKKIVPELNRKNYQDAIALLEKSASQEYSAGHIGKSITLLDEKKLLCRLKGTFSVYDGIVLFPKMQLILEQKENGHKPLPEKVVLNSDSIKISAKEYLTFFWRAPLPLRHSFIIRVRISGRGRLVPYVYHTESMKHKKDKLIEIPPFRVSSFFPRDYYFHLQPDSYYTYQSFGLRMKGNLKIEKIELLPFETGLEKKTIFVDAEIMEKSEIPDPSKAPYPDCLYSIKMKGVRILSGEKPIPADFLLLVPAFKDRKLTPEAKWKVGTKLRMRILPFEFETERMRQMSQSDTLDLFNVDRYSIFPFPKPFIMPEGPLYCVPIPFLPSAEDYRSGYAVPQNPPLSPKEMSDRKIRIATQSKRMQELLSKVKTPPDMLNNLFRNAWAKNRQECKELEFHYFYKKKGSFFTLPREFTFYRTDEIASKVQAVKALSDYFKFHGIMLIVALTPDWYDVAARVLNPEFRKEPDYTTARLANELLKNDVETIYYFDKVMKHSDSAQMLFYYPFDGHPMNALQDISANVIAQYLKSHFKGYFPAELKPGMFTVKTTPVGKSCVEEKNRATWQQWFSTRPNYQKIYLNGNEVPANQKSKLMLYGNSYLFTPTGEGTGYLIAKLTREMCYRPYVLARHSNAPLTALLWDLLFSPDQHLKGRKVCIFYYGSHAMLDTPVMNIENLDRMLKTRK